MKYSFVVLCPLPYPDLWELRFMFSVSPVLQDTGPLNGMLARIAITIYFSSFFFLPSLVSPSFSMSTKLNLYDLTQCL